MKGGWEDRASEAVYHKTEDFSCLIGSLAVICQLKRRQARLGARRVHEVE